MFRPRMVPVPSGTFFRPGLVSVGHRCHPEPSFESLLHEHGKWSSLVTWHVLWSPPGLSACNIRSSEEYQRMFKTPSLGTGPIRNRWPTGGLGMSLRGVTGRHPEQTST